MTEDLPGPDLERTPHLPRDEGGPVFNAPWEARAFAMTLDLHKAGVFTWGEWCETLADRIKAAQAAGDPDLGDTYYLHWLAALETIVTAKNAATRETLDAVREDWRAADEHRGFGEAPVLVEDAGGHPS